MLVEGRAGKATRIGPCDWIPPGKRLCRLPKANHEGHGKRAPGVVAELAQRAITIGGTFTLGTDFAFEGNVLMSARNFRTYFPYRLSADGNLDEVEIGLLKLTPHADPRMAQQALRTILPNDVTIFTKPEFLAQEIAYWQKSTPIGFVFGLGTVMGMAIGVMIGYQVLFTEVVDHLPQFATLKAMGYPNRALMAVVLQEALLLALLGFLPGLGLSQLLYAWLATLTGLPLSLTVWRTALVLFLTVIMCVIAGLIALRKVLYADPAEVFR